MPTNKSPGCRATLIAAPGSGQGKTLITAALARLYVNAGQRVQVFKVGPDYLDPMILQAASHRTVKNLDWWMMGETACLTALQSAASEVDVILVEGLMGLYDNEPSNAWMSKRLGLSVTLVMDMAKFAQTAAAVVHGMQQYDPDVVFSGVIGNRLGSQHHQMLVREAMPETIPYAGSIRRDDRMTLPSRHLGLVQAEELPALSRMLDDAATCLEESELTLSIPGYKPPEIASATAQQPLLSGKTIAVARDQAFAFIYPANLELLESLGAQIRFFSPLADETVPDCDALWLPGGYPELHLEKLAANQNTLQSIRKFVASDKPGLAECGGMMLLGKSITSVEGQKFAMSGAFAADFTMAKRFQSVGYQQLETDSHTVRGHSFHHSNVQTTEKPVGAWRKQNGDTGEQVYKAGGLIASYSHSYFASCPAWTTEIFGSNCCS